MKRARRSHGALLLLIAILPGVAACHFERRFPDGGQRDDAALEALTLEFYRAIAHHDSTSVTQVMFGAATVLLAAGRSEPSLIAWRALGAVPERRRDPMGVRVVRTEVRIDGAFATVRAVIAAQGGRVAGGESEASDLFTLAKRGGSWRIAHVQLGPWRARSAP